MQVDEVGDVPVAYAIEEVRHAPAEQQPDRDGRQPVAGARAGEVGEHPDQREPGQADHDRKPAREDAEGDAVVAHVPERQRRCDVDRLAELQRARDRGLGDLIRDDRGDRHCGQPRPVRDARAPPIRPRVHRDGPWADRQRVPIGIHAPVPVAAVRARSTVATSTPSISISLSRAVNPRTMRTSRESMPDGARDELLDGAVRTAVLGRRGDAQPPSIAVAARHGVAPSPRNYPKAQRDAACGVDAGSLRGTTGILVRRAWQLGLVRLDQVHRRRDDRAEAAPELALGVADAKGLAAHALAVGVGLADDLARPGLARRAGSSRPRDVRSRASRPRRARRRRASCAASPRARGGGEARPRAPRRGRPGRLRSRQTSSNASATCSSSRWTRRRLTPSGRRGKRRCRTSTGLDDMACRSRRCAVSCRYGRLRPEAVEHVDHDLLARRAAR